MKAVILKQFGTAKDALQYVEDFTAPSAAELKPKQVLLRVRSAAINPADWKIREGAVSWVYPLNFPCVIGMEGSGEVVATGSAVTRFSSGDQVFGLAAHVGNKDKDSRGTFAQFAIFDESDLAKKPAQLSFSHASAIAVGGMTILHAFRAAEAEVGKFKSILIHGASGGTGSMAVLLAKHWLKIEKVYATCSGHNADYIRSLGADRVIDYTTEDFVDVIKQEVKNGNITSLNLVLDCVGGSTIMNRSVEVLPPSTGVFVTISNGDDEEGMLKSICTLLYGLAYHSIKYWLWLGPKVHFERVGQRCPSDLVFLATFFGEHNHLAELIQLNHYDLVDLAKAHEAGETHRTRGKIVIDIPE